MKKGLTVAIVAALAAASAMGITACGDGDETKTYTVTYVNCATDETVKTETVKSGEKATEFTPSKDGYAFGGWYSSDELKTEFDFDGKIVANTTVYGSFTKIDVSLWQIAGSFKGTQLKNNNWGEDGRLHSDKYAFTAVENTVNTFELTVDLYKDDSFQFGEFSYPPKEGGYERVWERQMGFGCFVDAGTAFEDLGNDSASDVKKHDVGVLESGKYKFTITTDADSDEAGSIVWERLGDAPTLGAQFTPTLMGTFNGYKAGTDVAPEYFFSVTSDPLVWTLDVSLNRGDLIFVLPLNNYACQVNKDRMDESEVFDENSVYEIRMAVTGKFRFTLNIAKEATESLAASTRKKHYTVSAEKIGDYEKGKKENEYTVDYRSDAEGTDYTVYLKDGARFPDFVAPKLAQGETLMGWHFVGSGENGENVGIANENTYSATGVNGTIGYGVTTEGERDTRKYWMKGQGGTLNGTALGNWNKQVYLKQTGDHEYSGTLVLTENIKTMQICEDYLGKKTGSYYRGGHVAGFGELDYIDPTNYANIGITKNGVYEVTFNSMTGVITIVRTGDVPNA